MLLLCLLLLTPLVLCADRPLLTITEPDGGERTIDLDPLERVFQTLETTEAYDPNLWTWWELVAEVDPQRAFRNGRCAQAVDEKPHIVRKYYRELCQMYGAKALFERVFKNFSCAPLMTMLEEDMAQPEVLPPDPNRDAFLRSLIAAWRAGRLEDTVAEAAPWRGILSANYNDLGSFGQHVQVNPDVLNRIRQGQPAPPPTREECEADVDTYVMDDASPVVVQMRNGDFRKSPCPNAFLLHRPALVEEVVGGLLRGPLKRDVFFSNLATFDFARLQPVFANSNNVPVRQIGQALNMAQLQLSGSIDQQRDALVVFICLTLGMWRKLAMQLCYGEIVDPDVLVGEYVRVPDVSRMVAVLAQDFFSAGSEWTRLDAILFARLCLHPDRKFENEDIRFGTLPGQDLARLRDLATDIPELQQVLAQMNLTDSTTPPPDPLGTLPANLVLEGNQPIVDPTPLTTSTPPSKNVQKPSRQWIFILVAVCVGIFLVVILAIVVISRHKQQQVAKI